MSYVEEVVADLKFERRLARLAEAKERERALKAQGTKTKEEKQC